MANREEKKDKYADFAELVAQEREGVDFSVSVCNRNSGITIIAPHGGGIEPGTSEIARAIAGQELNLALFEGLKSIGNGDLHITSANFDEERCVEIVRGSDFVLAVHGKKRKKKRDDNSDNNHDEKIVYIGGLDFDLRRIITSELERVKFVVRIPEPGLQGIEPRNICNRGRRSCGVQFELTEGLRQSFFESFDRAGRQQPTPLFRIFVEAVRQGLRNGGAF